MSTRITVGICFFNDEAHLEKAIKSVFNQTIKEWKLILIDDGSSDCSLQIAKEYTSDSRVTLVSDGKNLKLARRLNQIADLSDTDYLARMDADDIMSPDRLAVQLNILNNNPEIDVLGANAYTIDMYDNIQGARWNPSDTLLRVDSFIHPSVIMRTSWAQQNKYPEFMERAQDAYLWYKTRSNSSFYSTSIPLLFYREVGSDFHKKHLAVSKEFLKAFLREGINRDKFLFLKIAIKNIVLCSLYIVLPYLVIRPLQKRRNKGWLSNSDIDSASEELSRSQKSSYL